MNKLFVTKPFSKRWMVLWLTMSITLLQVTTCLVVYNSIHVNEQKKTKEQILIMMKDSDDLQDGSINGLDIGIRGNAILKDEEFFFNSAKNGMNKR